MILYIDEIKYMNIDQTIKIIKTSKFYSFYNVRTVCLLFLLNPEEGGGR